MFQFWWLHAARIQRILLQKTVTVYEAAPTLTPLDLGAPGNSPGDAYYFSAQLYSSPGGRMIGEVFGSKTLIKVAGQAKPDSEKRATRLFFNFNRGQNQIIALGTTDYPPTGPEANTGPPLGRRFQHDKSAVLTQ